MRYASVCDGIGAVHVAWQPLGWHCEWTAEIDAFPAAVVEQRWGFPNRGDMTRFRDWGDLDVDLLVGGTPCQAFSVAGLRRSLEDERGNLSLVFVNLVDAIDEERKRLGKPPAICVWENVPGVLSTKDNAFGCFLAGLAGEGVPLQPSGGKWSNAGYVLGPKRAVAWRVLDAQYFGVAQRRRRVFLVASARDGFSPAAVLFECESVRRDNPPSREKGQGTAPATAVGTGCGGVYTSDGVLADPISAHEGRTYTHEGTTFRLHNCVAQPFTKSKRAQSNKDDETWVPGEVAPTFNVFDSGDTRATTVKAQGFTYSGYSNKPAWITGERTDCLPSSGHSDGSHQGIGVMTPMAVRRLTPMECERLQGFPDGYTAITYRNKPAADGPRYKALGNSMAVPVMAWIGRRIAKCAIH